MIEYERRQGGQSVELSSDIDRQLDEYCNPDKLVDTRRLFGRQAIADIEDDDMHHTLFNRVLWGKYRLTGRLKRHQGTHIRLPIYIHRELHNACSSISLPTLSVAEFALSRLGSQPSTYQKLDRIKDLADRLRTVEGGEGMADGLTQQMPFLIEGTKILKRKVL